MPATAKQVLLKDGGHGTVPFLVGAERRSIHGYPVIMARRSTLMAATDWTAQSDDAEAHHLLASQQLTDNQWKLFQSLWLYAHGDDQAFHGVTLSAKSAKQLRGYLGIEDSYEFRRATNNLAAISDEVNELYHQANELANRVTSLPNDQLYTAVADFDETLQERLFDLYANIEDDLPPAAKLLWPVAQRVPGLVDNLSHWNYMGVIAQYLPSYIRAWVNDNRASWEVATKNSIKLKVKQAAGTVDAAVLQSVVGQKRLCTEELLVPQLAKMGDAQHVVAGLARGMLCTPSFNVSNESLITVEAVKGEEEWDQLVVQLNNQAIFVLAELLLEVVRVGRKRLMCNEVLYVARRLVYDLKTHSDSPTLAEHSLRMSVLPTALNNGVF